MLGETRLWTSPPLTLGNSSLPYGSSSGHLSCCAAEADPATAFPLIFLLAFLWAPAFPVPLLSAGLGSTVLALLALLAVLFPAPRWPGSCPAPLLPSLVDVPAMCRFLPRHHCSPPACLSLSPAVPTSLGTWLYPVAFQLVVDLLQRQSSAADALRAWGSSLAAHRAARAQVKPAFPGFEPTRCKPFLRPTSPAVNMSHSLACLGWSRGEQRLARSLGVRCSLYCCLCRSNLFLLICWWCACSANKWLKIPTHP